jgi:hypothetical protein
VTILQLVLGMVSARSRYQLPRLVIRRAISSLFLAAPPHVLSLCLLRCKLRCVALRCFAARCANENMPTFFCLALDQSHYHTSPGMPSSSRRRTRHISAASQRSSSSSPARTCCRITLCPAHGPWIARWSVHLARLPSLSLVVCLCACLRRAARGSLPVSLCVFAAPTHPDESIPSIHITIHPLPRPTIPTLAHNPRRLHAPLTPPSLSSTDPQVPLSLSLRAAAPPTTPGPSSKTATTHPLFSLCSNNTHLHTTATT